MSVVIELVSVQTRREHKKYMCVCVCVCVYIYIYIYIYMKGSSVEKSTKQYRILILVVRANYISHHI
jgi:hypothetical protein